MIWEMCLSYCNMIAPKCQIHLNIVRDCIAIDGNKNQNKKKNNSTQTHFTISATNSNSNSNINATAAAVTQDYIKIDIILKDNNNSFNHQRIYDNKLMVKLLMRLCFTRKIRFLLMDKNYFIKNISASNILGVEHHNKILQYWNGKTDINTCHLCVKNRNNYGYRFFAPYEIKMLEKGDKIRIEEKNGRAKIVTIESIDWIDNCTKNCLKKGIQFKESKTWFFQNITPNYLRHFWILSMQCDLS